MKFIWQSKEPAMQGRYQQYGVNDDDAAREDGDEESGGVINTFHLLDDMTFVKN